MKSMIYKAVVICLSLFLLNCGGNNNGGPGPAVFEGTTLSMGEALQVEINQFFINADWNKDESIFFDVYLQDDYYGEYIVCAGRNDGLEVASQRGVYYGKLSIPMQRVEGVTTYESPEIKIVIVADQEDACPSMPDESKIIATATVTFNNLLNAPIALDNDMGSIAFRGFLHDDVDMPEIPEAENGTLVAGELYFDDSTTTSSIPQYYLVLNFADRPEIDYIRRENMPDMQRPQTIYSWLNAIFEYVDDTMLNEAVTITLNRFGESGPVEIGKTDETPIKRLISNKFEFTNGRGYIKFRDLP